MLILAYLVAAAIPALVLLFIYNLDKYKTGEFKVVILSFAAGVGAYLAAAQINPATLDLGWVDYDQMVRFLAPAVEEILKAAILFLLVRRVKFTYFVDGAIYGFAVGIGFAIWENFEYINGNPGLAMAVAVNRVVSTNLMHAAATSITGIILGWARFRKPAQRVLFNFIGILPAILLHMGYNNLVTRVESGLLLVYAVIVGGGAVGFIAFMIRRGLKEEGTWIEQKLGATDRVERQEVAAAQNVDKLEPVLKRLRDTFGQETAERIEKLLLTQARLGILRKTYDKMPDEKMRLGIQAQVDELRTEMEKMRKQLGSYAMVYLRYTHLEEIISVYDVLATRLQTVADTKLVPTQGIFGRLSNQLKEPVVTSPQEEQETASDQSTDKPGTGG